jgi:hypothetical protein
MRLFELLCGSIFNRRLRSTVPNAFCCYLVYCYVRYVSLNFFLNTRYVRPLLIRTYVYYFERAILSKMVFILQTLLYPFWILPGGQKLYHYSFPLDREEKHAPLSQQKFQIFSEHNPGAQAT